MQEIKSQFTPIGEDKITCRVHCHGKCTFTNDAGQVVCGAYKAPALEGSVERFTPPNGMRVCITSDDDPS